MCAKLPSILMTLSLPASLPSCLPACLLPLPRLFLLLLQTNGGSAFSSYLYPPPRPLSVSLDRWSCPGRAVDVHAVASALHGQMCRCLLCRLCFVLLYSLCDSFRLVLWLVLSSLVFSPPPHPSRAVHSTCIFIVYGPVPSTSLQMVQSVRTAAPVCLSLTRRLFLIPPHPQPHP